MLLIFDWDGTLIDSTAKIVASVQAAAQRLELPVLPDAEVKNIIGLSLNEALARLYPALSSSALLALSEAFSKHFVAADQKPCAFYEGVVPALTSLKAAGFELAVATGKSRSGLTRVLGNVGWSDFFSATKCAEETASKPHPLMLEQLLSEFGVRPHEAVMVGDTEYDMAMARSAGVPRIAVSYGAHHIDRMRPYEPALCLDRFADLLEWQPLRQRLESFSS
ncbi:HAD-IA family hydrolase [Simiduia litorea]|uniref:HAD-IA family hydrolase n=1 Tax=Simiduia litorea TaxID=1435348 RepID=UPI0036F1F2DA